MKVRPSRIPDVLLIEPRIFADSRGFFFESWNEETFATHGLELRFRQDNHSGSTRGSLRGLHYQVERPQGKLVRVAVGQVFDVAVDLRRSSPSFGEWVGFELSAANRLMAWIPPGFAHGFYVTSERAEFLYKTTDVYCPDLERALRWDDPAIGIEWPLAGGEAPLLSPRDADAPALAEAELFP